MIEALVLILAVALTVVLGIGLWALRADRPSRGKPNHPPSDPDPDPDPVDWARLEEDMSSVRTTTERSVRSATP